MARILVISPTPTHPPNAGNRARILAMTDFLRAEGHEVHFVHVARDPADPGAMRAHWGDRYESVKYQWPRRSPDQRIVFGRATDAKLLKGPHDRFANLLYWIGRARRSIMRLERLSKWNWSLDEWYAPAADAVIRRLHEQHAFEVVFVEYVYMSRALGLFGDDVLKVIDCHDVFSNRYEQFLANNERPAFFSVAPSDEGRALDRADLAIAIQPEEQRYLQAITKTRVVTVGHLVVLRLPRLAPRSRSVLFVGSPNSVNVHAVQWFVADVLPILRKSLPDAKLLVAGKVCQKLTDDLDCTRLGELPDLAAAYDQADVVVNPRRFGTGLSIKSIEALGYGIPLVALPAGHSGMDDGANQAFVAVESAPDMAAAIVRLFTDVQTYRSFAEAGREYAARYNEDVARELRGVLARAASGA